MNDDDNDDDGDNDDDDDDNGDDEDDDDDNGDDDDDNDDLEAANSLLYDTYHPDEPLNKHLGLTAGGRRIKDCDAIVEQIVPRHLCLFALHPSGKPIGVAINNDCQKSELEVSTDEVHKSYSYAVCFSSLLRC